MFPPFLDGYILDAESLRRDPPFYIIAHFSEIVNVCFCFVPVMLAIFREVWHNYVMKRMPIVALIGQTNAGKSSILNRMARKNIAIVAREEGTTRDNVVARIDDTFVLIDTAGLKDPSDDFEASIQEQILDAIDSADVILVTLDSSKYFDHRDAKIAKDALRSGKPVFLVLNKCDLGESLPITEFRALGFAPEKTFYVSATTGQGIKELKEGVLSEPIFLGPLRGARPSLRPFER